MKKKIAAILTTALVGATVFSASVSAASGDITVVSREEGSGTRGAFIELFGIEEKQGDENALGYISLGSLDDTVKALKIDGAEASAENVADGTYKVSRPFNIITGEEVNETAQDFINFIMSADGQQIIEYNGYIKVDTEAEAYESTNPSGKVVVAGSSSVTPVMEKLSEAYQEINADVTVEVQQSDSTTGITSTKEGICDIGMASRNLKDEEKDGLTATVIAQDGIAVIVNPGNELEELTSEQVKAIFTGETTTWEELAE